MEQAQLERTHVEIAKLIAEQNKLNAEQHKLIVEAAKITLETFWYPLAIAVGVLGTVSTVTALLIKYLVL